MTTENKNCPCFGRGWLIATRSDDRDAVERCDACQAFESDEAAAKAANEAGTKCLTEYPCLLVLFTSLS